MFTGIIETTGKVEHIEEKGANISFTIKADFITELKVDQSVAHNGVCLTVESISEDSYVCTAIDETLKRTNLGSLGIGNSVNLERCMKLGDRLDGHIVQGHVDCTAICAGIVEKNGSHEFTFELHVPHEGLLVEKGSVTVNGVSLTVVSVDKSSFVVAIIPYTLEHTSFKDLVINDQVNIEFDILGKYVASMLDSRLTKIQP